ncbi:MAG: DUF4430 domain-containing protein [Syntrophomonadaceae bacterium]
MQRKLIIGCLLIILLIISGCSLADTIGGETAKSSPDQPVEQTPKSGFTIRLSRDFGQIALDERQVELRPDNSLLQYMEAEHQITTGYGGGFIVGINGLVSAQSEGRNSDWFFFVNGTVAAVGADQLKPAAGDIVWWDYHNWSDAAGQSAVIGCYPQPLVDHPVKILTDQRWMKLAHECQEAIIAQGAGGVEVADLSEQESQLNKPTCPVIVIGTWEELQQSSYLHKWNQAYDRHGASIHFTDDGLELLGVDGQVKRTLGTGAGVIVASGQGLGDNNPLWLIAGVDDQGVREAVQILSAQPDELSWKYGLAVQAGQIMALPVN